MTKQKTIAEKVEFNSIGLHSGEKTKIVLNPTKNDIGIVFRFFNKDENGNIESSVLLPAKFDKVVDTRLGTIISNREITVLTIEHLMSSLWACDIDNIIIDIENIKQEIPILDGSARNFIQKIKEIGTINLQQDRRYLKILKEVVIEKEDFSIKIEPSDNFSIDMTVNYQYGNIGEQHYYFDGNQNTFINEVAQARTFCNQKDIEFMQKNGLAKGGSLDNAIVFNDNDLINNSSLRCENEVVKHKILDCVGDMFTCGFFIKGKITSKKGGHSLNNELLRKVFADKNSYKIE